MSSEPESVPPTPVIIILPSIEVNLELFSIKIPLLLSASLAVLLPVPFMVIVAAFEPVPVDDISTLSSISIPILLSSPSPPYPIIDISPTTDVILVPVSLISIPLLLSESAMFCPPPVPLMLIDAAYIPVPVDVIVEPPLISTPYYHHRQ